MAESIWCWLKWLPALLPLLLAACAGPGSSGNAVTGNAGFAAAGPSYAPTRYYPPPGPPDDPWGPYINAASARFAVPAQWIRAVMAQESGGEEQAVSPVGAIGLMQVMPDTYQELQASYGLGADPFDPRDNILAGTAYIKEMYDKYGAPGFLAAYNAGPDRLDEFLAGTADLPDETVNYLADVTPNLGDAVPFTGPLATYAAAAPAGAAPDAADFATGCDPDAAYDPGHPCAPAQITTASAPGAPAGSCDADRAYDPDSPCTPGAGGAGVCDSNLAYDPDNPCAPAAPVIGAVVAAAYGPQAAPVPAGPPAAPRSWAIQVGAFANASLARAVAEHARAEAPDLLASAAIAVPATDPFGNLVLYRARLTNLSADAAIESCARLAQVQLPCVVEAPRI